MPVVKTLLLHGGDATLAALLAEQLDGWVIHPGLAAKGDAALLAGPDGPSGHVGIAASLRAAGMVGPIFSLESNTDAPLIALARPFRVSTLLQRLRMPDAAWIDGIVIGKWRLDVTQRSLVALSDDRIERLTDKELALLKLILVTLPRPVDRETLQTEIWRYHAEADTHTVETHVWRLRQKLEDDPGNPQLLVTVADGYTLTLG